MLCWLKYIDPSAILRVHPRTRLTAWTMTQSGGMTLDLIPGEEISPLTMAYPVSFPESASVLTPWAGRLYPRDFLEEQATRSLSKVRADLKSALFALKDLESTWSVEGHIHFLVQEPARLTVSLQDTSWEVRLRFAIFLASKLIIPGADKRVEFPFETLYTPVFGVKPTYSLGDFGRNVFAPTLRKRTTGSP